MVRASDHYLRVLAPMVAFHARETPAPILDSLLAEIIAVATRRGLRSILADIARVAEGGELRIPLQDGIRRGEVLIQA